MLLNYWPWLTQCISSESIVAVPVFDGRKFDIISDENHDSQKVELKYEGEQTELERERGTVDYVNQRKIDNEEEIKKFSKFWLV